MGQLESLIKRCDVAIFENDKEKCSSIVHEYLLAYQKQVDEIIGSEPRRTVLVDAFINDDPEDLLDSVLDISIVLGALKERRDYDLAIASAGASLTSMSVSQTVTTTVSFSQTMSTLWSIPDEVIDPQKKEELGGLLKQLEESKPEGNHKVLEAAKAVGSWLFDQAVKAVPMVMPYVAETIKGIL